LVVAVVVVVVVPNSKVQQVAARRRQQQKRQQQKRQQQIHCRCTRVRAMATRRCAVSAPRLQPPAPTAQAALPM
jgi:hypothetical protein